MSLGLIFQRPIDNLLSVICYLLSIICYLLSVIWPWRRQAPSSTKTMLEAGAAIKGNQGWAVRLIIGQIAMYALSALWKVLPMLSK